MKIEKLKITPPNPSGLASMLRSMKPGECIRLKTAQDYRKTWGQLSRVTKETGLRFASANDGESDVLVFLKEDKSQKTS